MNKAGEAKLCSSIHSTFDTLVVGCMFGGCCGENLALSVDQCWLQALQFLVHLIDLLSILLRCDGFAWIQKAIVGQTDSDHDIFSASLA